MDQIKATKRDDTKIRKSRTIRQPQAHYIPPAQRSATKKIIDRTPENKCKTYLKEDVNIAELLSEKVLETSIRLMETDNKENKYSNKVNDLSASTAPVAVPESKGFLPIVEKYDHICNSLEKIEIASPNSRQGNSQSNNNFLRYQQNCDLQMLDWSTRLNDERKSNIEVSTKPDALECQQNADVKSTSNWKNLLDENQQLEEQPIKYSATCPDDKIVENDYADLDHVIELYDFSPNFKTRDLIKLYSSVYVKGTTFIKWCDDTHALLVFTSSSQATRALDIKYHIVKSRPLSKGSDIAISIAYKSNLQLATKRPQTSMQTARRLITTHLGKKSSISKEEVEQEQHILQVAREKKKQDRQNATLFGKIEDLQSEQTE